MTELYGKVAQFVDQEFERAGAAHTSVHLERTAFWVAKLQPLASEALMIAARSHDIERAFRQEDMEQILATSNDGFENSEFLLRHQTRGAEIMAEYLKSLNVDLSMTQHIKQLIAHHEEGGDEEQNILKDADTISFFENNVDGFIKKHLHQTGKKKVEGKFNWMYQRLSSQQARDIATPMYELAIRKLS